MSNSRNPNYTIDEDRHLCRVYKDVSQDGEIGINQKKDAFWGRVSNAYNEKKLSHMSDRSARSVESRISVIQSATSKFKGCIQQVEYRNPSGASENDIMNMAKELMMLDPKYAKGFKFEHVWDLLKDFQKFDCKSQQPRADIFSSQSDTPVPESPQSPTANPSFSINLSEDSGSGSASASKRPMGVKKSKMKKKKAEDISTLVGSILESNKEMRAVYQGENQQNRELLQKKVIEFQRANDLAQWEADNKILMMDTTTIPNMSSRLYFEQEQIRIIQKRTSSHPGNDFNFGNYFPGMGGSGSGLGEY